MVEGELMELTPLKRPGRGHVFCWLVEADVDLSSAHSNTFELKSGSNESTAFPEIDAFEYCAPALALQRIHESLRPVIEEALHRLGWVG